MHDQADQLRKLVREAVDQHVDLAPGAPIIAISGAQPEVGATTLACGLARELARFGKQVVLIDANLAAPALAERLHAKPLGTLADVLAGTRRAIEVLAAPADGIRLLGSAASTSPPPLDAEACARLQSELAALCRQSDAVLVDAGHGMTPWVDRLWQLASQVLLVAAPASSSIIDAYAAIKQSQHERIASKLQLAVTRCDAGADADRIYAGLSATCERFLGHPLKPPAVLPTLSADDDALFQRSVRLLAADLACDCRALAARIPSRRMPSFSPRLAAFHGDRTSLTDS
jgi:flagellar biosynthesis protein FlhG